MKSKATALAALLPPTLLLLAGCASENPRKPPKYTPSPPPSSYGDWYIEPVTCTIRARAADFSLATDGIPRNGTIELKTLFISPLVQPPMAEVSEILAPVPVEGSRRGYRIVLAYDSVNAAHMLKDDTYLMVRYQPLSSADVLESSFPTHGLMFAMADLAKYCTP